MPDVTLIFRLSRALGASGVLSLVAAYVAYQTGDHVASGDGGYTLGTAGAVWVLVVLGAVLIVNGSVLYHWSVEAGDAAEKTPTD